MRAACAPAGRAHGARRNACIYPEYTLHAQVRVAKEELDAVSDLRYAWKKLRKCASEASDQLAALQARAPPQACSPHLHVWTE